VAIESEALLTVKEVAERLRVHPITVRRLIASGRLPAVRIGRAVRVRREDVENVGSPEKRRRELSEPSEEEWQRRREAAQRLLQLRDSMTVYQTDVPSSLVTSEELIRQERRMLARKHNRSRKPFDEMRKLRDQMEPMDISTAELVRLGRSAREWMYDDEKE